MSHALVRQGAGHVGGELLDLEGGGAVEASPDNHKVLDDYSILSTRSIGSVGVRREAFHAAEQPELIDP